MLLLGDQIASGMEYLSSRRIVHGDLAARNVLVGAEAHVKISDLGLGRHTYPHEYYAPAGVKTPLPVRWLPPESIFTGVATSESDVWSLAVTLWEVSSTWIGFIRRLYAVTFCFLYNGGWIDLLNSVPFYKSLSTDNSKTFSSTCSWFNYGLLTYFCY